MIDNIGERLAEAERRFLRAIGRPFVPLVRWLNRRFGDG